MKLIFKLTSKPQLVVSLLLFVLSLEISPHSSNSNFLSLFEPSLFQKKSLFSTKEGLIGWQALAKYQSSQMEGKGTHPPEDPAVTRFREYLRTDSAHPNPNYDASVSWLENQAHEIGLTYSKVDFVPPGLFAVVMTWEGLDPSLGSIMLNSHIDVVPVDRTKWKHDPFAAVKDSSGNIFARGAQDRKSLGTQYLEAIRRLKSTGYRPKRNVYVTFVPDEEVGGERGMLPFLNSEFFNHMNVSLELDEGGATPNDAYAIFYGERSIFRFKVVARGNSSHSAFMLEDNAGVKLNKVMTKLFEYRGQQMGKLKSNPSLAIGDITSINMAQIGGGVAGNVVPSEMWAVFDMRVRLEPSWQFSDVRKWLDAIIAEVGPGVSYELEFQYENKEEASINPQDFWWNVLQTTFNEQKWKFSPRIMPTGTDARRLRKAGIQSYGFCPLLHTEALGHQDNEFLNEKTFLDGIKVYEILIPRLADAV